LPTSNKSTSALAENDESASGNPTDSVMARRRADVDQRRSAPAALNCEANRSLCSQRGGDSLTLMNHNTLQQGTKWPLGQIAAHIETRAIAASIGGSMKSVTLGLAALLVALGARPSFAHFQELLPSSQILEGETQRNVTITALFTHPMAGSPTMNMGQPTKFGVIGRDGKRKDLLSTLKR
jgi:hypothetical protein